MWRNLYFAKGPQELALAHSMPRVQKLSAIEVGSFAVVGLPGSNRAACRWRVYKNTRIPQPSRCDCSYFESLPRYFIPSDQQTPPARARAVISSESLRRRIGAVSDRGWLAQGRFRELPVSTPMPPLVSAGFRAHGFISAP